MGILKLLLCSAILWPLTLAQISSFFFYANQSDSLFSNISKPCNLALSAPVSDCARQLLWMISDNDYYTVQNITAMDILCRSQCPPALASYRSSVVSNCTKDPQPVSGYPATYWVDAVVAFQQQLCLKDSKTGQYCTQWIEKTLGDAPNPADLLGGYDKTKLCSECIVNLFKQQQATPFSNYDVQMAKAWAAIQSNCNLNLPTATQPLKTNVTSLGNYAPPGYPTASCVSGRTYKVVSGDNCVDISKKNHVSTGSLIALNSLRLDCTNIFVDQTLCLPLACNDYVVQNQDTCVGIATNKSTSFQQIVAWNPTIDDYCSNLIAGQNICVGPPGGVQNFTTIPGATVTKTASYGTSTAARPTSVAAGTTTKCAKYYLVQPGDNCEVVALNQTVPLSTFRSLNPSINSGCTNLQANVWYCVLPTQDFDATTTSTTVPPPTSTPPGSTNNCYQWYVIRSGDDCGKVTNNFGITFAQFQGWNPSLKSDCSNLQLGVAYCVNGAVSIVARATVELPDLFSTAKLAQAHGIAAGPMQTSHPDDFGGGVPIGWPGVDSRRLRAAMGLPDRREL